MASLTRWGRAISLNRRLKEEDYTAKQALQTSSFLGFFHLYNGSFIGKWWRRIAFGPLFYRTRASPVSAAALAGSVGV
ncbi:MAG: hypothetical protein CM1200mP3_15750 [Chloroflexota bacterium]|nr:MAG: hypothetical protein CM1200mP3_15750 [Chloroflexota bacterium]